MFWELHSQSYIYRLTEPPTLEPDVLERHKTYIVCAQLGASAGLLGACLLGLEQPLRSAASEAIYAH
jgi:glucokinase